MPSKYEAALAELYKAPFEGFVGARKRLSDGLRAAGDAGSAAQLAKRGRPSVSAWAVNQLWWNERKAFDALFKTAERLRDPDADADETAAHRDAVATLRTKAAKLLTGAGKSATESTLRRVTATLTALAATGGFGPDSPGELTLDRDPPGFEVAGLLGASSRKRKPEKAVDGRKQAATAHREKAEALAERRRAERERERLEAQKKAERDRLERKLRIARSALEERKEELTRLKERIAEAEAGVEEARGVVRELEKEIKKA